MIFSIATIQPGLLVYLAALLLWSVGVCIYRLYFSPLAKFPGPKLAAATGWVETYYDVFKGGKFIFKYKEWHEKYGPIVRINPWEVHIADPDFADTLFAGNSQYDKKKEWKYRFGIPLATGDTIEHSHHRIRRGALLPFFAQQKIAGIHDFISSKAQRLCDRLDNEFKGTGIPVTLNNVFTAFAFDTITYYAFARPFDYIEHPTFSGPFTRATKSVARNLHLAGHFPWLVLFMKSLPRSFLIALKPTMAHMFNFHDAVEDQIRAIISGENDKHKEVDTKTVFHELLNSDLPSAEKSAERLRQEAISLVSAGTDTTGTGLPKAIYFILSNPSVKARLLAELETVFPDPRQTPPLATLEQLPYLAAVINETLRAATGVSGRTVRSSPQAPVLYQGGRWVIPAGAYFSSTTHFTHYDPKIWEAPHEFRPERWLDDPVTGRKPRALNGEPLAKYLLAFGGGPRRCAGMTLARAELVIGLAVLFRRCDLELFETGYEAIEMKSDFFIPFPDPKTQGVRALIK